MSIVQAHSATLIRGMLKEQQRQLEVLINMTPTGNTRNALCDANIHVQAAILAIKLGLNQAYSVESRCTCLSMPGTNDCKVHS